MFSTIGHEEREKLEEQFERMRYERKRFDSMTGEQIAWFTLFFFLIFFVDLNQECC